MIRGGTFNKRGVFMNGFSALLICILMIAQVSCTISQKELNHSKKRSVSSEAVSSSLETTSLPWAEYRFFQEAIANPSQVNFSKLMENYDSLSKHASELANVYRNYSTRFLGIDPENMEAWLADPNHARLRSGIMYYIDDPGNMDVPYWVAINTKLRKKLPLTSEEKQVKDQILWSLDRMPQISGVVFRGVKMTPDRYQSLKQLVGMNYTELGFTSSSISPGISARFGQIFSSDSDKNRVECLWIMKIKRGGAVSYFHYDPYMFEELEALLEPGASFRVTGHFEDLSHPAYPKAIFLMEQIN